MRGRIRRFLDRQAVSPGPEVEDADAEVEV